MMKEISFWGGNIFKLFGIIFYNYYLEKKNSSFVNIIINIWNIFVLQINDN